MHKEEIKRITIEKEELVEFICALANSCEDNEKKDWYIGLLSDIEIAWPETKGEVNDTIDKIQKIIDKAIIETGLNEDEVIMYMQYLLKGKEMNLNQ